MRDNPLRDIAALINDGIGAQEDFNVTSEVNKRAGALIDILTYMPELDYKRLKLALIGKKILYLLPGTSIQGEVKTTEGADIIFYLSPALESESYDKVLFTVGHELGHITLNHLDSYSQKDFVRREQDASELGWKWVNRIPIDVIKVS